jgi:hypothetical protein
LTVWIQVCAEEVIAEKWKRRQSLYLHQILRELDPDGSTNLDAGTLRKELEASVFQGNLTKHEKRIVDKDQRARRVVYYEPTPKLLEIMNKF